MKISINKIHWPVTVLGHGNRVGIWMQGCTTGCPDCCSKDTWETTPDQIITLEDLIKAIVKFDLEAVDGYTVSGGEPFHQPQALKALLLELKDLARESRNPKDILVYSGFHFNYLQKEHKDVCDLCDLLITGPYLSGFSGNAVMGSGNQDMHLLTDLARERYFPAKSQPQPHGLQVHFDGEQIWMIGVPKKDDLKKLETLLHQKGIEIENLSWRG